MLFNRLDFPDRETRLGLIQRFDPLFPADSREMNAELGQFLVYLETPGIAGKMLKLMAQSLTQEEQLEYADRCAFWKPVGPESNARSISPGTRRPPISGEAPVFKAFSG